MKNNIKEDLELFNQLTEFFLQEETNRPISEYLHPHDVTEKINVRLSEKGVIGKKFKESLQDLLLKSPKSSSRLFFNQLFGGRHSKAVLGDLLAVMLNNSMATYKIAGPLVLVEKEILNQIFNLIGYINSPGGTFPTGGSMSNFMSLIMARDKVDLKIKHLGISQKLVAYTSENAHYSLSKNASFSGIGRKNVRYITSQQDGKLNVKEFERQVEVDISNGLIPFYLNATAGTTVLCAFDNIEELAPVCKKHNIWLHLDGAFGGGVIFSKKYRHLVSGINLTDSFCFNAHKTLGAPLSTSILVVKNKDDLYNSFHNEANYLYQTHNDEFNLGQTSFECGRRNNSLKMWTMWKAIGTQGISDIIDQEFELAELARNYVSSNPDYKLYSFKESLSICFSYKDFDSEDLCKKLYEHNTLMVGFGVFKNKTFVRLVIVNCENTKNDIIEFFRVLEEFARTHRKEIKKV